MSHTTSLKEKKADMADTDLSMINGCLKPSLREHRMIPPDFQDNLYLPSSGSRSLEHKEFQGTDHQQVQNVETMEYSRRYGPACIVDQKNRKVEAPRNKNDSANCLDKEEPQNSKAEGIQFKNGADANLYEEVLKNVDIREDYLHGKRAQNPSSPIPSDEFVPSETIFGTEEALERLAQSYRNEELKTGIHGVYTDLSFAEILHNPKAEKDLASGSFGVVTVGEGPSGFMKYVRKKIEKDKFHPTEAKVTNKARHENVIHLYGFLINLGNVELIMEFAGQSLHSMVEGKAFKEEGKALEEIILSLTSDICKGLDYLECQNVVHFDIKPRNLFVQGDEGKGYLLKIGDFGSASMSRDKHKMKSFTLAYCAPEMAQYYLKNADKNVILQSRQELEQRLQPKTDVFSAALVVGFMHKGEDLLSLLFKEMKLNIPKVSEQNWILRYLSDPNTYQISYLIPETASQKMKRILERMLSFDIEERYSASDCLKQIEGEKEILTRSRDVRKEEKQRSFSQKKEERNKGIKCWHCEKILKGKREINAHAKHHHNTLEKTILLTDDQPEGFPTNKKKLRLPTKGYQTGCLMQEDEMGSSTKQFSQASVAVPSKNFMYDVYISDNSYPICQAQDD